MARYMDADALIEKMHNEWDMQDTYLPIHFEELLVNEMPTAYNVDKVVQELEEQIDSNRGWEDEDFFAGETNGFEVAIKIVKAGGIRNGGKE